MAQTSLATLITLVISSGAVNLVIGNICHRKWVEWREPDGSRYSGYMISEASAFFMKEGKLLRRPESNPTKEQRRRTALRWMRISGAISWVYFAAALWPIWRLTLFLSPYG